jgi:hypothetical protein
VDYVHAGTASEERLSLERVVLEPLPWPGHPDRALDGTGLGLYRLEVRARGGAGGGAGPAGGAGAEGEGRVLYSRGFSTVFAEWQTTAEAARLSRSFQASLRFPAPEGPVDVVVLRRDGKGDFQPLWRLPVDPAAPDVERAPPPDAGPLIALQKSGPPADKVDLLLLGDGYTRAERGRFERDARRLMEALFAQSPFRERRGDFNVWGLVPASRESGVARPSAGLHRRSALGTTYDAFGAERYVLTFDNRALREAASQAPYEAVEVLVNSETYGGGGIYGTLGTVAARSRWADYLFVHEFAHHFAALADEYYTSQNVYAPAPADRREPWERNATALLEPARLKWADLVRPPSTPLPTPWGKEAFEQHTAGVEARRRALRQARRPEAEMDALLLEQQRHDTEAFSREPHRDAVGAFEGANYEARGYFRPQLDCVMFSRNRVPFCAVCQAALDEVISLYAGPPAGGRVPADPDRK